MGLAGGAFAVVRIFSMLGEHAEERAKHRERVQNLMERVERLAGRIDG